MWARSTRCVCGIPVRRKPRSTTKFRTYNTLDLPAKEGSTTGASTVSDKEMSSGVLGRTGGACSSHGRGSSTKAGDDEIDEAMKYLLRSVEGGDYPASQGYHFEGEVDFEYRPSRGTHGNGTGLLTGGTRLLRRTMRLPLYVRRLLSPGFVMCKEITAGVIIR